MSTKKAENLVKSAPDNSFQIEGLADRLKIARKKLKISGEKMAQKIGVAQTTISWWETAKGDPPFSYLALLANEFNYDLNWLILGIGDPHGTKNGMTNDRELELLKKNEAMADAMLKKDEMLEKKDGLLEVVITALVKGGLADSVPQELIAQYAPSSKNMSKKSSN